MNFPITPHRAKILSVLLEQGDIDDPTGQATTLLMAETGHRTTNALSGVLLAMENAGLIDRDKAGRRTYRIGLTKQGRKVALANAGRSTVEEPLPAAAAPAAAVEAVMNGAVDLDLLAGVLLKKALAATQAQEASAGLKEANRRIVELEEELRAARDEAAELRAVAKTLEHNNKVLVGQMDRVKKNPGRPIKELISSKEMRDLEQLMQSLPAARG